MTSELAVRDRPSEVRNTTPQENWQAFIEMAHRVLASFSLGGELGLTPREVANRSAVVTLTALREDEKAVTLIVAESEGHLHEVVETVRSPGVYRYKVVERSAPVRALPEPSDASANPASEPSGSDSQSSKKEEQAEA